MPRNKGTETAQFSTALAAEFKICWLYHQQKGKTPLTKKKKKKEKKRSAEHNMTLNYIWSLGSSFGRTGSVDNFIITITHRSIMTRNGSIRILTQSAGAEECTDCFPAEGVRPPPSTSVLDMTLNNLMVRFQ